MPQLSSAAASSTEKEIDAIELLKSQHREVENLFAQIEATSHRAYATRSNLFSELARKLTHHSKIEEKFFYPEGREVDEDSILEAIEEHNVARLLIRQLAKTDPSDETYMAKITVLKEIVAHHVREEENELFPEMSRELGTERILELGEEMQTLYARLESTGKRSNRKKA